jgi:hypothetical protein
VDLVLLDKLGKSLLDRKGGGIEKETNEESSKAIEQRDLRSTTVMITKHRSSQAYGNPCSSTMVFSSSKTNMAYSFIKAFHLIDVEV